MVEKAVMECEDLTKKHFPSASRITLPQKIGEAILGKNYKESEGVVLCWKNSCANQGKEVGVGQGESYTLLGRICKINGWVERSSYT